MSNCKCVAHIPKHGKQYAERDIIEQGAHYALHISHMTSEELHSKSDIAAELAHRDIRVAELEEYLSTRGATSRRRLHERIEKLEEHQEALYKALQTAQQERVEAVKKLNDVTPFVDWPRYHKRMEARDE